MLQFDLSPLIGARPGERLSFVLDEGPQDLGDIEIASLRGLVLFTRIHNGILAEGELETLVEIECVRCLEPFVQPARLELEETIGFAGRPRADIPYRLTDEGWFDLLSLLRELVWVALPIKPICRPDCRGYCPECGVNLNVGLCQCQEEHSDPRLAVLATFRQD